MKHLFIVNPAAGRDDMSGAIAEKAARVFSDRREDYEIYVTKAPRDAEDVIQNIASNGDRLRVYACGGDGTLSECVSGAAGLKNVSVTHFPCGTGNDFIKTFGTDSALFCNLSLLVDGEARPIDVIRCNNRHCINICSVGFDARVGANVHKYSRLPLIGGAAGYVVSTAAEFIRGINQPMRISCDGWEFIGDTALVCACNGRYYGGGFNPVPSAMPDDGGVGFLVAPALSRLSFVRLIGDYAGGRYDRHPGHVIHLRSGGMTIDSDDTLIVNLDGEIIRERHIALSVVPGGVSFVFPKGMSFFKNASTKNEAIASNS